VRFHAYFIIKINTMPLKTGLFQCPSIGKVQLHDLLILIITTFYY